MPRRSLRCVVEINIHALTCPGVYLPRRDDIYLSICLFGQVRRTQLTSAVFPLIFHERFKFDKVFYTAYTPSHVAASLEDEPVIIELIQMSDIYEGGKLLASYETSARDFLYPFPSYTPTYGTQDREILMERSLDFPGISPKLEFATQTIISELDSTVLTPADVDDDIIYIPKTGRRSRSRTRTSKKNKSISYGRPTVSSISRTRSLSPSMRRKFAALNIDDEIETERPPFVVRKVQSKNLIGRMPGTPSPKQKIRCMHGTYGENNNNTRKGRRTPRYTATTDALDLYTDNIRPSRYGRSRAIRISDDDIYSDADSDLLDLTTSRYRSPSPSYRATSPIYRSTSPMYTTPTLSSRYLDRSYSPVRAELIKSEVDRAIERNRETRERLERLDRLYPYSTYRYQRDLTALDELELELELARRRRSDIIKDFNKFVRRENRRTKKSRKCNHHNKQNRPVVRNQDIYHQDSKINRHSNYENYKCIGRNQKEPSGNSFSVCDSNDQNYPKNKYFHRGNQYSSGINSKQNTSPDFSTVRNFNNNKSRLDNNPKGKCFYPRNRSKSYHENNRNYEKNSEDFSMVQNFDNELDNPKDKYFHPHHHHSRKFSQKGNKYFSKVQNCDNELDNPKDKYFHPRNQSKSRHQHSSRNSQKHQLLSTVRNCQKENSGKDSKNKYFHQRTRSKSCHQLSCKNDPKEKDKKYLSTVRNFQNESSLDKKYNTRSKSCNKGVKPKLVVKYVLFNKDHQVIRMF